MASSRQQLAATQYHAQRDGLFWLLQTSLSPQIQCHPVMNLLSPILCHHRHQHTGRPLPQGLLLPLHSLVDACAAHCAASIDVSSPLTLQLLVNAAHAGGCCVLPPRPAGAQQLHGSAPRAAAAQLPPAGVAAPAAPRCGGGGSGSSSGSRRGGGVHAGAAHGTIAGGKRLWLQVISDMCLTDDQVDAILTLRTELLRVVNRCFADRAEAAETLLAEVALGCSEGVSHHEEASRGEVDGGKCPLRAASPLRGGGCSVPAGMRSGGRGGSSGGSRSSGGSGSSRDGTCSSGAGSGSRGSDGEGGTEAHRAAEEGGRTGKRDGEVHVHANAHLTSQVDSIRQSGYLPKVAASSLAVRELMHKMQVGVDCFSHWSSFLAAAQIATVAACAENNIMMMPFLSCPQRPAHHPFLPGRFNIPPHSLHLSPPGHTSLPGRTPPPHASRRAWRPRANFSAASPSGS